MRDRFSRWNCLRLFFRLWLAAGVWGLILGDAGLPAAEPAADRPAANDRREVFLIRSSPAPAAVIHDYGRQWVEFGNGGERFAFHEISRTAEMLELHDRSRDVRLRIHAESGELRLRQSPVWEAWARGTWIRRAELAPAIPFVPTDWRIRLVYFVPRDRRPLPRYAERVRVVLQLMSDIYRRALRGEGVALDELPVERDGAGEPVVHLVRGRRTASEYNGSPQFNIDQQFRRVGEEIPPAVGVPHRHLLLVFPETYEPGPAPIEWNGSLGVGRQFSADGGLAMMSAWMLRDEFCGMSFDEQVRLLRDATPITGRTALGTRQPDSPRFEFIEDGWGAVAHELGHALGLPHDYRSSDDLMGHGFRNLQKNYLPGVGARPPVTFSPENARLLAASRYLNPQASRADDQPPQADLSARRDPGAEPRLNVRLDARDDTALRAVVFYDPQRDSVIGGAALNGKTDTVEQSLLLDREPAGAYSLVALLVDAAGNFATVRTMVTP